MVRSLAKKEVFSLFERHYGIISFLFSPFLACFPSLLIFFFSYLNNLNIEKVGLGSSSSSPREARARGYIYNIYTHLLNKYFY